MKTFNNDQTVVRNLTWDANATQRGLDKAAQRVASAVEKGTQRVVDESKNSRKAIVDAVGKIKSTTNAEHITTLTPAVKSVCQGLRCVSESAAQIADYFYSNPSEWRAVGEKISTVNDQFSKLGRSVDQCSEGTCLFFHVFIFWFFGCTMLKSEIPFA